MSPEELNQELFDFVKSLKERADDLQLVAKRIQLLTPSCDQVDIAYINAKTEGER